MIPFPCESAQAEDVPRARGIDCQNDNMEGTAYKAQLSALETVRNRGNAAPLFGDACGHFTSLHAINQEEKEGART